MIKTRLRILQVIPFYVPAWGFGGPVRVCSDIATELVSLGNTVTVATTDALDATNRITKKRETIQGVKVVRFKNISSWLAKEQNGYLPVGFASWMRNNIDEFDIVHIHSFFTYQNIIASRICQKNNVPYIVHLHESLAPSATLGRVGIKKIFNSLWGKKILINAQKILVASKPEHQLLIDYMPIVKEKVFVLPNPISNVKTKISKQEARKKLGLPQNNKIILSLSRVAPIKRIDLIIRALAMIIKKDNRWLLLVVGPGEQKETKKLQHLAKKLGIEKDVIFYGLADHKKRDLFYRASDVYVLVSRYESFGITALEALNSGLPVCVSGAVPSVIACKNCCIVVKNPKYIKSLSGSIMKSAQSKFSNNNANKITSKYLICSIVKELLNLYYQFTNKK